MSKEDHIKIYFTTLLHEVIDSMDEICDSLEWSEEKEFLTSMFLISFIGFNLAMIPVPTIALIPLGFSKFMALDFKGSKICRLSTNGE